MIKMYYQMTGNSHMLVQSTKKDVKTNYRPVSLTCILCKVMESIIRDQVMYHLRINNTLSPYQYGFINKRSTTLQLLNVLDKWTFELDQGKEIEGVYFDFQKAFDSVPHKRLLLKLEKIGIKNKSLNWKKDFLENRYQVWLNGALSNIIQVKSGIPQGSVLGPILFIIYVNDNPDNIKSNIMLFADDAKLFQSITINQVDDTLLREDLQYLETWSDHWLLK